MSGDASTLKNCTPASLVKPAPSICDQSLGTCTETTCAVVEDREEPAAGSASSSFSSGISGAVVASVVGVFSTAGAGAPQPTAQSEWP